MSIPKTCYILAAITIISIIVKFCSKVVLFCILPAYILLKNADRLMNDESDNVTKYGLLTVCGLMLALVESSMLLATNIPEWMVLIVLGINVISILVFFIQLKAKNMYYGDAEEVANLIRQGKSVEEVAEILANKEIADGH